MQLKIDRQYLLSTLKQLVEINSVNPTLVPGAPGEEEIAYFLVEKLRNLAVHVDTFERAAGRPSVVGTVKGAGQGASLMLNAHLDTVGVEGMQNPFTPVHEGNRLYGRGSYDMKGSLAACLSVLKALQESNLLLKGDLVLAAVSDEEYASLGTSEVLDNVQVDAAVVTEPTELNICLAHKGFVWVEVQTQGQAAHGSQFQLGVDANMMMGRLLSRLESLGKSLERGSGHPLLGPASLHAAMLSGGTGLSTYADRCTLKIERRTLPGETSESVTGQFQKLIDKLCAEDEQFSARLKVQFVREPFEVDSNAALVRHLAATAAEVTGQRPGEVGENPWMDSALLAAAGVETVVFGPSGGGAHSLQEWVDVDSLTTLAEILLRLAIRYCGEA